MSVGLLKTGKVAGVKKKIGDRPSCWKCVRMQVTGTIAGDE